MRHTRSKFLGATLTVLATSALSCGGEAAKATTPPAGPNCLANGALVNTGSAYHTMRVSKEDVQAGVEKTYNIQGTGTHQHIVTLTAEHFAQLQANQSVTVNSTSDKWSPSLAAHNHRVIVQCI